VARRGRRPHDRAGRPNHRPDLRHRTAIRRPDVAKATAAAAKAFQGWRNTTPSERQGALLRLADAIEARSDKLVAAESRNTGKPLALTASEELPPMVDHIRFFAGAARVLEGRSPGEYLAGHTSFPGDSRQPRGHRVELPDMTEREGAQERSERRGSPDPGEQAAHRAVPQQVRVVDRVRAGAHPRDQGRDLQVGVGTAGLVDPGVLAEQVLQPGPFGELQDRCQARARH